MKAVLLLLAILINAAMRAQTANLYQPDEPRYPVHAQNVGRIVFTDGNIPLESLAATDFLRSFELRRLSSLNLRVFMNNSLANYLHQLRPELNADELLKIGNLQFSFFVDGKLVYTENIHHGCGFGSGGNKATSVTFRVPFTTAKGEDWWSVYLFERFRENGGNSALTEGTHILEIEIRPYLQPAGKGIVTGSVIAKGGLELVIKPLVITPEQVAVQPIAPGSGWKNSRKHVKRQSIEALNAAIAKDELKDITSVVVVYKGGLLLEEYFNGAQRDMLHDTRSAGKSFTSTLLGIALDEKHIDSEDANLSSFYPLEKYANYSDKKGQIALKHLLTMSSAFAGSDADEASPGNEENMYPTDNWVKFALDLPLDASKTNGGQWDYFTAGVVLLGDILNKTVPGGLLYYSEKKLFRPLGITNYRWQFTPQGVPNTAGSLQMRALDYARYVQLYKDRGVYNGARILSEAWIEKTLKPHMQIQSRKDEFYGYLFWNRPVLYKSKKYNTYYCAGNGGNQFIIFENLPLVVVITSRAYNKPYAHQQAQKIITDYIFPALFD